MSKKNKIMISCNEANHNCDKSQYNEATLWEKFKLNIHLIYCRACRKYSKNNSKLTKMMNNSELEYLKSSEKDTLKRNFKEELSKNN
jgi:predicted anti-sigma-YlaC factor YlaD